MWLGDWQTAVALVCVATASLALLNRVRSWANGTAKSGCGTCPSRKEKAVVPLSTLQLSSSLKARQAIEDE